MATCYKIRTSDILDSLWLGVATTVNNNNNIINKNSNNNNNNNDNNNNTQFVMPKRRRNGRCEKLAMKYVILTSYHIEHNHRVLSPNVVVSSVSFTLISSCQFVFH